MGFFTIHTNSSRLFRAILISLFLVSPLNSCSDKNNAVSAHKIKPHNVHVQTAQSQDIAQQFNTSAVVEAVQSLQITNQLIGMVIQVNVQPGDSTKRGDTLITLDTRIIEAELIKSQVEFEQTSLNLKRLKNLAQNKLSSEDEIAKAQTAIRIAQANLNLQKNRFNYSHILAPFDGVISQRLVNESDVLPLHQHLLTLINTQQLKVKASLSAAIIPQLQIGNKSILHCGNITQHSFISRIYPSIEINSQQGQIEIQWQNTHHNLLPGQFCQIKIINQTTTRLMIPNTAIQYNTHGAYVFIATDTAHKTPIIIGLKLDKFSEVISGLKEGSKIITAGLLNLTDGKKIKITSTK